MLTDQELIDDARLLAALNSVEIEECPPRMVWMPPKLFRKFWMQVHPFHNRRRALRRNRHK